MDNIRLVGYYTKKMDSTRVKNKNLRIMPLLTNIIRTFIRFNRNLNTQ